MCKKYELIYRIADANLNRLKEGIRVIEDIYRFYFNNQDISLQLKKIRHLCRIEEYKKALLKRDIINDPLKISTKSEKKRDNIEDIIIANFKRAQESARVLEEILKLISIKESENFNNIRYELYNIEKICL